jgi:DNA helicase-4
MIQGLVKESDRFLLAVGDDWQSINRFAGSDISVMRTFETWYGESLTLELTKTFRCPHAIAHVASTFVKKNPYQFKKNMMSLKPSSQKAICVRLAPEDVLDSVLEEIVTHSQGEPSSVLILGRYNFLRSNAKHGEFESLNINFRTIHSSKGLEADYIIVLGLTNGQFGFPSEIADDPVLALAMPESESFPFAEERRLFYVALTRARKKVFLLTSLSTISPFVIEILRSEYIDANLGDDVDTKVCSKCKVGLLVKRTGPWGDFLGCSRFPTCAHTEKIQSPATPLATTNSNE